MRNAIPIPEELDVHWHALLERVPPRMREQFVRGVERTVAGLASATEVSIVTRGADDVEPDAVDVAEPRATAPVRVPDLRARIAQRQWPALVVPRGCRLAGYQLEGARRWEGFLQQADDLDLRVVAGWLDALDRDEPAEVDEDVAEPDELEDAAEELDADETEAPF
jgi:hypothetical protein